MAAARMCRQCASRPSQKPAHDARTGNGSGFLLLGCFARVARSIQLNQHQRPNLNSTTRTTLSARCSTKRLLSTSRPGSNSQVQASSTARATTTHRASTCARRFAIIWNAASLRMALPGPGVMTAATTTLLPIPAKAVVSARRATRGAWWRWQHT